MAPPACRRKLLGDNAAVQKGDKASTWDIGRALLDEIPPQAATPPVQLRAARSWVKKKGALPRSRNVTNAAASKINNLATRHRRTPKPASENEG
jgi:hypothetical protein